MEDLLISIIIPAYNAVEHIEDTINSCLAQTYQNIEIIVQDDCSKDGTWELVNNSYSSNTKVKLFRNKKNLGIGDNWNAAYEKALGDFVIIFNADDLIKPDLIQTFLRHFELTPTLDIITGKFDVLISETGYTYLYPDHVNLKGGLITNLFEHVYGKCAFHWNYTLVKKALLEKVKLPNGRLFLNTQICDAELWYRCYLANAKVYFDDSKIWGYYRKHSSNNSSNPNGELKSYLKDFLHYHQKSIITKIGNQHAFILMRSLITYCNLLKRRKTFDVKIFLLYLKRITQGLI